MRAEGSAARELNGAALRVRTERSEERHLVALRGELDLAAVELVEEEMRAIAAADGPVLVLDLSGLEFIDSTGIHLLLRLHADSEASGNRLRVVPGPPAVQRVLELTGVDEHLPFITV